MGSKHGLSHSFGFALKGIKLALNERNFIIELLCALLTILFAFVFHISSLEWLAILLCIALVLGLEIVNTAIEKTIDLLHPHIHETAGQIKDLMAAAVLVAAFISVVIAAIIFIPKIS